MKLKQNRDGALFSTQSYLYDQKNLKNPAVLVSVTVTVGIVLCSVVVVVVVT